MAEWVGYRQVSTPDPLHFLEDEISSLLDHCVCIASMKTRSGDRYNGMHNKSEMSIPVYMPDDAFLYF